MKTIEEEFPPEDTFLYDYQLTAAYTELRARAVEMERENRFLSWRLACAEGQWSEARKLEREGALDGREYAELLPPAPESHQTTTCPNTN